MSPPKTKYEGVETCGGKSKAPGCGRVAWLAGQGGLKPPLHPPLSSPMLNTKKLAGSKGRRIGPMKRTAKHGVRSPNACTKKHSQDGKAAVLMISSNPKTVRSEIKTNPVQEECGLQTPNLAPLSAAVPAAIVQRRRARNNANTKERSKRRDTRKEQRQASIY